jgi:putative sterol carrier protein
VASAADTTRFLAERVLPALGRALGRIEDLRGLRARVSIELSQNERWTIEVDRGRAMLAAHGEAFDVLVEMDARDWTEMWSGALRPRALLIDGRLSISGDLGLAARLWPAAEAVLAEEAKPPFDA